MTRARRRRSELSVCLSACPSVLVPVAPLRWTRLGHHWLRWTHAFSQKTSATSARQPRERTTQEPRESDTGNLIKLARGRTCGLMGNIFGGAPENCLPGSQGALASARRARCATGGLPGRSGGRVPGLAHSHALTFFSAAFRSSPSPSHLVSMSLPRPRSLPGGHHAHESRSLNTLLRASSSGSS